MTFSIVAKDPASGAFGVATATGGPNVGTLVPYARANSGAIATQGYTTNPFYGIAGLEELAAGKSAQMLCDELTAADMGRHRRQCVIIDTNGNTAAWTGEEVSDWNGAVLKRGVAAAGNLLTGPEVLEAMIDTYLDGEEDNFEQRMLNAITAGNTAGGDKRGTKSAALKIFTTEPYPHMDARVDMSEQPMERLAEIVTAIREPDFQDFLDRIPTKINPSRC